MFEFSAANPNPTAAPPKRPDTPAMQAFQLAKMGAEQKPLQDCEYPEHLTHPVVQEVAALYEAMHDKLEAGTNHPGWRRGVYPTPEVAANAFGRGTLYLLRDENGALAGSVVLNHEPEEAYANSDVHWGRQLSDEEIFVVHTLVVHPAFQGQGAGQALLAHAEGLARAKGLAAIRLDTWEHNAAGKGLYEKCGYTFCGTADFGLAIMGLQFFHLYEKLL